MGRSPGFCRFNSVVGRQRFSIMSEVTCILQSMTTKSFLSTTRWNRWRWKIRFKPELRSCVSSPD